MPSSLILYDFVDTLPLIFVQELMDMVNRGFLFPNSHPYRSKAWPLPASKEQLDLPCSFVSFAKHWPVVCHQNILSLSMLSRGRSLTMPQPFGHEVYSNVFMKQNKKRFQGGRGNSTLPRPPTMYLSIASINSCKPQ